MYAFSVKFSVNFRADRNITPLNITLYEHLGMFWSLHSLSLSFLDNYINNMCCSKEFYSNIQGSIRHANRLHNSRYTHFNGFYYFSTGKKIFHVTFLCQYTEYWKSYMTATDILIFSCCCYRLQQKFSITPLSSFPGISGDNKFSDKARQSCTARCLSLN